MKRLFLGIYLFIAAVVMAEEPDTVWLYRPTTEERVAWMRLVDSLTHPHIEPLSPNDRRQEELLMQLRLHPVIPPFSLEGIVRPVEGSSRILIINDRWLQVGPHLQLSNGQAWLWGGYPIGYLDARTLSLPLP